MPVQRTGVPLGQHAPAAGEGGCRAGLLGAGLRGRGGSGTRGRSGSYAAWRRQSPVARSPAHVEPVPNGPGPLHTLHASAAPPLPSPTHLTGGLGLLARGTKGRGPVLGPSPGQAAAAMQAFLSIPRSQARLAHPEITALALHGDPGPAEWCPAQGYGDERPRTFPPRRCTLFSADVDDHGMDDEHIHGTLGRAVMQVGTAARRQPTWIPQLAEDCRIPELAWSHPPVLVLDGSRQRNERSPPPIAILLHYCDILFFPPSHSWRTASCATRALACRPGAGVPALARLPPCTERPERPGLRASGL